MARHRDHSAAAGVGAAALAGPLGFGAVQLATRLGDKIRRTRKPRRRVNPAAVLGGVGGLAALAAPVGLMLRRRRMRRHGVNPAAVLGGIGTLVAGPILAKLLRGLHDRKVEETRFVESSDRSKRDVKRDFIRDRKSLGTA